jgi:peptide/nickel transport system substrate-binding protein
VVGAGPFVVREYVPGQRIRFERNPHFFGRDGEGRQLPYVDGIEMSIVPEANTEMLRLQGGDSDVITNFATADDLASLRQAEAAGRVQLADAGPSVDVWTLWFDLRPGAASAKDRPWLQAPEFRRALSHAINRQAIVDTVYLGQAVPVYGPISPGHGPWYQPDLPRTELDLTRARTLLSSIGLTDRNGDGTLEDGANRPVRFSIITRSGVPHRERTVTMIQEQLRPLGIAVDVAALTQQEIVQRFTKGDFDAIYFGALSSTREPGAGFWQSSGPFHFWHPGQAAPATEWEARVDQLFQQQAGTVDRAARVRLFAEAQRVLADNLPAIWLVAPRQIVPVSSRLRGVTPQIFFPPVLWNAERISLANGGR